jgi:hypothetical protein
MYPPVPPGFFFGTRIGSRHKFFVTKIEINFSLEIFSEVQYVNPKYLIDLQKTFSSSEHEHPYFFFIVCNFDLPGSESTDLVESESITLLNAL